MFSLLKMFLNIVIPSFYIDYGTTIPIQEFCFSGNEDSDIDNRLKIQYGITHEDSTFAPIKLFMN